MRILGIETSCDETAICLLEASGTVDAPKFTILGNALYSQIAIHAQYGGVFPNIAKREHATNLVPMLIKALGDAGALIEKAATEKNIAVPTETKTRLAELLQREYTLAESLEAFLAQYERPNIDAIAVTAGPGLEPALWVGINFATALGEIWNVPVYPTNHMEGHIVSALFEHGQASLVQFPALSLLISGGHTELVLVKNWKEYQVIGQTKDDAVGEAFDKVARMLELPYPGGPQISKLANEATAESVAAHGVKFPRPMIHTPDFDFSFSGLKTAVLYFIKKQLTAETTTSQSLSPSLKAAIAKDFEDSVVEVLIHKTRKALETHNAKTLILGGGVIANKKIRAALEALMADFPDTKLLLPQMQLTTDNAIMIAIAGYLNILLDTKPQTGIKAQGNLSL